MRVFEVPAGASGIDALRAGERARPVPGPHEVLVRIRAAALNFRDLAIVSGKYIGGPVTRDLVPLSDGAGEVEAVGAEVTRFAVGDRVVAHFSQGRGRVPLGSPLDGMLREYAVFDEDGLLAVPAHLDFEAAATLPCTGVTAWNALFEGKPLKPGETVLTLGTGGVSIFALQLARLAGARVIITSSSDEKLEKARALGADALINYRETPEWAQRVLELTDGRGVDHLVETAAPATLPQYMDLGRGLGHLDVFDARSSGRHLERDLGQPEPLRSAGQRARVAGQSFRRIAQNLRVVGETLTRRPGEREKLKAFLDERDMYLYTVNAFPYGPFKNTLVKEQVYEPDWRRRRPRLYTMQVADILAEVSGARRRADDPEPAARLQAARDRARGRRSLHAAGDRTVAHLVGSCASAPAAPCARARAGAPASSRRRTRRSTISESPLRGSRRRVAREADGPFRGRRGRGAARHLGMVYDICHQAVEYEDIASPAHARRRRHAGVQAAGGRRRARAGSDAGEGRRAASVCRHRLSDADRRAAKRQADPLPEPRGRVRCLGARSGPARVAHALSRAGVPRRPRRLQDDTLRDRGRAEVSPQNKLSPHLEIETYTWDVLPEHLKTGDIVDYVTSELEWVRGSCCQLLAACALSAGDVIEARRTTS
jgi:NADPH:quinone reductase-like Zn-dependent oxidoreductase